MHCVASTVFTCVILLALCAPTCYGYQGFDCGQGTAILLLRSHVQCGASSQVACFDSVAMRVRNCSIKAWAHRPHKHHRLCKGLTLQANVSNVNNAQGYISGPLAAGGGHASLALLLEFSRPDESMYVRFGGCSMRFDVESASDASLRPVPGEDDSTSLLMLVLPAVLVPCMCVGLIVAVGSITSQRARTSPPCNDSLSLTEHLLTAPDGNPQPACDQASSSSIWERRQGRHASHGFSVFSRTFNMKAMSRRAFAKRLRRSVRPVYVGVPQQSVEHQQMYVAGKLQPGPGPCNLVAPCFRFPPVAMPPPLEAIPEVLTPSSGPSRSSSSPSICIAESPTSSSAAADAAGCV